MTKRPSLASLGDRLARKAGVPEVNSAQAPSGDAPQAEQRAARSNRQPDGRKGILVRARPEAWKALKHIALDGERTLQDVMVEAINDVLSKHGKPPLA